MKSTAAILPEIELRAPRNSKRDGARRPRPDDPSRQLGSEPEQAQRRRAAEGATEIVREMRLVGEAGALGFHWPLGFAERKGGGYRYVPAA